MSQIVGLSEYRDSHSLITFTIPAGAVAPGSEWKHHERIPMDGALFVREINALATGWRGDADLVLNSGVVRLVDLDNDKNLFERPLGILIITNRNAETEERLARLERMMNVLVEQESPAGEALRRLGGAKIDYESPTRLARPALFNGGCTFSICLRIHDSFTLLNDVTVQVSIAGISKRPIL